MANERLMQRLTQAVMMALAGVIGALLVHGVTPRPPAVVQVQLKGLVQGFVRHQAEAQADAATTQTKTRQFSQALDDSLAAVARRHHAAVVPAGAVITGAPDVTGELNQQLNRRGINLQFHGAGQSKPQAQRKERS